MQKAFWLLVAAFALVSIDQSDARSRRFRKPGRGKPQVKSSLQCPSPSLFFCQHRYDQCESDRKCQYYMGGDYKCCYNGCYRACVRGLDPEPRDGVCPAGARDGRGCRADYTGCRYDSECPTGEKCCELSDCSYKECRAPAPEPRSPELICPGSQFAFCPNHLDGVRPCETDGDCGAGNLCCHLECGKRCERGLETTEKDGVCPATEVRDCLQDFGGCQADSECPGEEKCCLVQPCGYKQCTSLRAEPPQPERSLSCPRQTFFFCPPNIRESQVSCDADSDCGSGELCCHMECGKRCEAGLDTTPKDGVCPSIREKSCLQDFTGCSQDSECPGQEKCCRVEPCGYSQCSALY